MQVEVYGPGIESGVRVGAPTEFTVDCSKSGPGDVTVNITSAKRKTVPVSINDNGDDTYTVTYEAQVAGPQTILINLDDSEVPQSPIKLDIKPAADLSKIALIDFEPEAFVDCPNDFIVDTSGQLVTPINRIHPLEIFLHRVGRTVRSKQILHFLTKNISVKTQQSQIIFFRLGLEP